MYEAHFGLEQRPFSETVSPSAYVAVPSRDAVLRRLHYALEHGQGPAVLFGPSGSGKTLLARRLASELSASAGPRHLSRPCRRRAGGAPGRGIRRPDGPAGSLSDRAATLARTSSPRWRRNGERPLLVVDDAHLIDDVATFEALRLLLNFATQRTARSFAALRRRPGALARAAFRPGRPPRCACLLGPLTEAESSTYVLGRLAAAGAKSASVHPGCPDLAPPRGRRLAPSP